MKIKRRDLLKSSLASIPLSLSLNSCVRENKKEKEVIRGFIFSDAHIGWNGKAQPSVALQKEMIQRIKQTFPNLDLVFDTGDIHHGNLNEKQRNKAREEWLNHFAGAFPQSVFHYIPGNHELGKGKSDTELTASKLGSQNFRPYYSFDFMGIHFVSLPQLMDTILITQESLNWLEMDLKLNSSKTTLIFSHNSLTNTTFTNGETGYRVVVNSEQVFDVINKFDHVISWLHGHNHQYEVVKKDKRLYVSNGRIGGFNPPESWGEFGQGHLGGIYFEISKSGMTVKAYSASKQAFLEDLGYPQLTKELKVKTSFNPKEQFNYYFGHGSMISNVHYKAYSHYLSEKKVLVISENNASKIINENAKFNLSNDLFFNGKRINRVIAYGLKPKNTKKTSLLTGLKIEPDGNNPTITLPKYNRDSNNFITRGSYYRCQSGDNFSLDIMYELSNQDVAPFIVIVYKVLNESHHVLFESIQNRQSLNELGFNQCNINIPNLSNSEPDAPKYLKVDVKLENLNEPILLKSITLSKSCNEKELIEINDTKYQNKVFSVDQNIFFKNGVSYLKHHNHIGTYLYKLTDIQWQIRNAIGTLSQDNTIQVINYRHSFQKNKEVILTPTSIKNAFLSRVLNLMPFQVTYLHQTIEIIILGNIHKNTVLEFAMHGATLTAVEGAQVTEQYTHKIKLVPESKRVVFYFKKDA